MQIVKWEYPSRISGFRISLDLYVNLCELYSALPVFERSLIGNRLSDILNRKHSESGYIEDDEVLDVVVLREEDEVYNDSPEYGSATFDESGRAVVKINGKVVDEKEMEANTKKRYKRIVTRREARIKKRRNKLYKLADRNSYEEQHPVLQKSLSDFINRSQVGLYLHHL